MSIQTPIVRPAPKPLSYVLAYRNEDVLGKFRERFTVSQEEAEDLFTDVKKYLWLSAFARRRPSPPQLDMFSPLVDELWHTFILFTKMYHKYCEDCFGYYIHHSPHTDDPFKINGDGSLEELESAIMERRRGMYQLVYDQLGEQTFFRWFRDHRARHTLNYLDSIMIPLNRRRTEERADGR